MLSGRIATFNGSLSANSDTTNNKTTLLDVTGKGIIREINFVSIIKDSDDDRRNNNDLALKITIDKNECVVNSKDIKFVSDKIFVSDANPITQMRFYVDSRIIALKQLDLKLPFTKSLKIELINNNTHPSTTSAYCTYCMEVNN